MFFLPFFFIYVLPPTDLATLCPRVSDIISSRHFIARRQHLRFPPSCPGFESGRWFRVPLTFWIVFCQRTQETKLRKNLKNDWAVPCHLKWASCNAMSPPYSLFVSSRPSFKIKLYWSLIFYFIFRRRREASGQRGAGIRRHFLGHDRRWRRSKFSRN